LDVWKFCKSNFAAAVLTEAWLWKENDQKTLANDNPIGGSQNVTFRDCL
jgi:hypothetical protein